MSAFAVTENSVVLTLFEKDASINSAKGATPVIAVRQNVCQRFFWFIADKL